MNQPVAYQATPYKLSGWQGGSTHSINLHMTDEVAGGKSLLVLEARKHAVRPDYLGNRPACL
jgi:hypothetical protein